MKSLLLRFCYSMSFVTVYFQHIDSRVKSGNRKDDLLDKFSIGLMIFMAFQTSVQIHSPFTQYPSFAGPDMHALIHSNGSQSVWKNIDYFETMINMVFYVEELQSFGNQCVLNNSEFTTEQRTLVFLVISHHCFFNKHRR